jgi:hypothetical protein
MNTPTTTSDQVYLERMLVNEITITQDSPCILYQIPFELTKTPNRVWKQLLLDIWQSKTQHKSSFKNRYVGVSQSHIN